MTNIALVGSLFPISILSAIIIPFACKHRKKKEARQKREEAAKRKFLDYYLKETAARLDKIIEVVWKDDVGLNQAEFQKILQVRERIEDIVDRKNSAIKLSANLLLLQIETFVLNILFERYEMFLENIGEIKKEKCPVFQLIKEAAEFAMAAEEYYKENEFPVIGKFKQKMKK